MRKWACLFGHHDWTNKAMEGIPPKGDEVPTIYDSDKVIVAKFRRYAQMYCKHCPKKFKTIVYRGQRGME